MMRIDELIFFEYQDLLNSVSIPVFMVVPGLRTENFNTILLFKHEYFMVRILYSIVTRTLGLYIYDILDSKYQLYHLLFKISWYLIQT